MHVVLVPDLGEFVAGGPQFVDEASRRRAMAVARAKGRLRGKQPKLSPRQEAHLVELYRAGGHTIGGLEELFPVTRSTIYRAVARAGGRATGTSAQSATR